MSSRAPGTGKAAALRKVRRITGAATGTAALSAAVFGGVMSHEIPGTSSAAVVAAKTSGASASTTTTVAPTTTTTSPTVVSGATSG
jgi:hypothetical protein